MEVHVLLQSNKRKAEEQDENVVAKIMKTI